MAVDWHRKDWGGRLHVTSNGEIAGHIPEHLAAYIDQDVPAKQIDVDERWLNGECHLLAQAIKHLTGWPMFALVNPDNHDEWAHVVVQTPNGDLLDAEGLHDPDFACQMWASCFERPGVYEADMRTFPFKGWETRVKRRSDGSRVYDYYAISDEEAEVVTQVAFTLLRSLCSWEG